MSRRFFLLALLLTGCHLPGTVRTRRTDARFEDTGARLSEVALAFASETEGLLTLGFEVQSPAENAARIDGLTFELILEGRRFATGARQLRLPMLPARVETFEVKLPLVFVRQRLLEGKRPLDVEVRGTLSIYEGGAPEPWPFAWKGPLVSDGAPSFEEELDQ